MTARTSGPAREAGAGAPRDALETELCSIWQGVLQRDTVNVGDNFFAHLGGDSVACLKILAEVDRVLGTTFDIADFYAAPTPRGMAERIRSGKVATTRGPVVRIQAGQDGGSVYAFHPLSGTVLCYVPLARAMGLRHTVWGLQAEGVEPGSTPLPSIDAMADHYVTSMRAVHRPGPWHLVGYSMGGFLALEVARRLRAQGEDVKFVGLIDTDLSVEPAPPVATIRKNAVRGIARLMLNTDIDHAGPGRGSTEEQLEHLLGHGVAAGTLPANYGLDRLRRLVEVHVSNRLALSDYRPRPYEGTVTLFRSCPGGVPPRTAEALTDRDLGWSSVADAVRVHDVRSDHFDIMESPAAATVAETIRAYLEGDGEPQSARAPRTVRAVG